LKDSGATVTVGVREGGKGWTQARADGLETAEPAEAVKGASLVAFLAPDMAHDAIYADVAPNLEQGSALLFAHGFSVYYGRVKPRADLDVILVAPKGPGDLVRREYERGRGVPCLFAAHQDATGRADQRALAYARGIGGTS